jgi:hypothetical protein
MSSGGGAKGFEESGGARENERNGENDRGVEYL